MRRHFSSVLVERKALFIVAEHNLLELFPTELLVFVGESLEQILDPNPTAPLEDEA